VLSQNRPRFRTFTRQKKQEAMKKIELYVSDEDAAFLEELLGRLGVSYSVLDAENQSSTTSPMPKKEEVTEEKDTRLPESEYEEEDFELTPDQEKAEILAFRQMRKFWRYVSAEEHAAEVAKEKAYLAECFAAIDARTHEKPAEPEEQEALNEAVQESGEDIAAGRIFSTKEIENEIAQWRKHTPQSRI